VIACTIRAAQISIGLTPFLAVLLLLFLRGEYLSGARLRPALLRRRLYFSSEESHLSGSPNTSVGIAEKQASPGSLPLSGPFMAGSTMGSIMLPRSISQKNWVLPSSRPTPSLAYHALAATGGNLVGILVDRFRGDNSSSSCFGYRILYDAGSRWPMYGGYRSSCLPRRYLRAFLSTPRSCVCRKCSTRSREDRQSGFLITLGVVGLALIPYLLGVAGDLSALEWDSLRS